MSSGTECDYASSSFKANQRVRQEMVVIIVAGNSTLKATFKPNDSGATPEVVLPWLVTTSLLVAADGTIQSVEV